MVLLAVLLAGLAVPAGAQAGPTVALLSSSGPPGQSAIASGRNFDPGSCTVSRSGETVAFGDSCNGQYDVPMPAQPGMYTISFSTATQSASASYRVESDEPSPTPSPPPPSPTPTPTPPPPPPPPPSPTPTPTPTPTTPQETESPLDTETPSETATPTEAETPSETATPTESPSAGVTDLPPMTLPGADGAIEIDGVLAPGDEPRPITSPCRPSDPTARVVDVDGRSLDEPLHDLGQGIRVVGAGDAVRVRAARAGSVTPPLAVQHLGEGPLVLDLGEPSRWVGLHVGRDDDGGRGRVRLIGRNAEGDVVARAAARLPAGPAPVFTCVELTGRGFTTLEIASAAGGRDIDEVVDLLAVAGAPPTRDGLVEVELEGPSGEVTLHPDVAVTVAGTVTAADELALVDVWQSYTSARDPGRQRVRRVGPAQWVRQPDGSVRVWADGRLASGEGRVGIHARTVTGASATTSQPVDVQRPAGRVTTVGEGADLAGDGDTNLVVAAVEVTQGMRAEALAVGPVEPGTRLADDQAFVAGRRTVVRVIPTADTEVAGVTARLIGSRDGHTLGGGPLAPVESAVAVVPSIDVPAARRDTTGVLTFVLPASWTDAAGPLTLAVQLDPPGVDTRQACDGCRDDDLVHLDLVLAEPARPLLVWPRTREGVARTVVADVLSSLQRWLPLPSEAIELAAPVTTPVGAEDVAAWTVLDVLAERAAGDDVLQLWLDAPGSCEARALIGTGMAAAGACSTVPAHAVAHTLGLEHAADGHGDGEGCGAVAGVAVDITSTRPRVVDTGAAWGTAELGLRDTLPGCETPHAHDLMSAGGRTVVTSPSTWEALSGALADSTSRALLAPVDRPGDTQVLVLDGDRSTSVVLDGAHAVVGADDRATVDGDEVPARAVRDETGSQVWVVAVPFGQWERIEVDGQAVERGDDLQVTLDTPTPDAVIDGPTTVSWSVSDGSGRAVVEVSSDGGAWWPVAVTDETSITLPNLPVGGPARLRVQVSDGARHGSSAVVDVAVPPRSPEVLVMAPRDGARVAAGQGIELRGLVATEVEPDDLVWEVDGVEVARGPRAMLTGLGEGRHEVVFRAVDRVAAGARMAVSIVVQGDTDADGLADAWEVANGLDPLDPHDGFDDGDADGAAAVDEHRAGALPTRADTDGDGAWDGVELAAGTDLASAASVPGEIHTWPQPLPTALAAARASWWTLPRIGLLAAVVLVLGLDAWLVVRRRRRRRYG